MGDARWVLEAAKKECALEIGCGGSVEFAVAGWSKVKIFFFDFIKRSWGKQWEILLMVISKYCLWWFESYWRGWPIFGHIPHVFLIHNDLTIATKTTSQLKDTLLKAMEAIQNVNLTLNLEKCIFGKSEIKLWGMLFTLKG